MERKTKTKIKNILGRCNSHTDPLPYLDWHDKAAKLSKKGIKQIKCKKCGLYLWPYEWKK